MTTSKTGLYCESGLIIGNTLNFGLRATGIGLSVFGVIAGVCLGAYITYNYCEE